MKVIKQSLVYSGRWLNMNKADFEAGGVTGVWEFVSRPTRVSETDGVGVLARVIHEGKEKIVTVASYRLPVNQWVLEFPSGMVEKDDKDIVKAALREFKEETGLTVEDEDVKGVGKVSFNDPWKSNESNVLVKVDVNLDMKQNLNPVQDLDPAEFIRVEFIPVDGIMEYIEWLCKEKQYGLDSRVYTFALGIEIGQRKSSA